MSVGAVAGLPFVCCHRGPVVIIYYLPLTGGKWLATLSASVFRSAKCVTLACQMLIHGQQYDGLEEPAATAIAAGVLAMLKQLQQLDAMLLVVLLLLWLCCGSYLFPPKKKNNHFCSPQGKNLAVLP